MEWGFDGVLINTAVSRALDPVRMASAFASAVKAGRAAFVAGPMPVQKKLFRALRKSVGRSRRLHCDLACLGTANYGGFPAPIV
jgi:Thiazole biosynthesis protein ThiG